MLFMSPRLLIEMRIHSEINPPLVSSCKAFLALFRVSMTFLLSFKSCMDSRTCLKFSTDVIFFSKSKSRCFTCFRIILALLLEEFLIAILISTLFLLIFSSSSSMVVSKFAMHIFSFNTAMSVSKNLG